MVDVCEILFFKTHLKQPIIRHCGATYLSSTLPSAPECRPACTMTNSELLQGLKRQCASSLVWLHHRPVAKGGQIANRCVTAKSRGRSCNTSPSQASSSIMTHHHKKTQGHTIKRHTGVSSFLGTSKAVCIPH